MSGTIKRVAFVVITYNREDFIVTCLNSLLSQASDRLMVDIILVDNNSPDNTRAIVNAAFPNITYIQNNGNLPLPIASNIGIDAAMETEADYILLLNDDIELQPNAVDELVSVCDEAGKCFVTTLQVNYRNPEHIDESMLNQLRELDLLLEDAIYHRNLKRYYDMPTIIGAALFSTRESFAQIGNFDTHFSFYGIDDDYCNRARHHGYRLLMATKAIMFHAHGKTTDTHEIDKAAWFWRWKSMYRARMIFRLKDPGHTLLSAYIKVGFKALWDSVAFILKGWPKGSVTAVSTFVDLFGCRKKLKARRELDYPGSL